MLKSHAIYSFPSVDLTGKKRCISCELNETKGIYMHYILVAFLLRPGMLSRIFYGARSKISLDPLKRFKIAETMEKEYRRQTC